MGRIRYGVLVAAALLLCAPEVSADVTRRPIRVGGKTRYARVLVPPRLPEGKAVPLVFVFHGAGSTVSSMVRATGFDVLAARHGFLVAYPEALGGRFDAGARAQPDARHRPDDVAFVRALLADLRKRHRIDPRRIYATGFSNGAMFCYRLAAEMSDEIAAIAPVAGALGLQVTDGPSSPVSALHVHGTEDMRIRFRGPGRIAPTYRSVPDTLRTWANWCGCRRARSPHVDRLDPTPEFRVERRWYDGCPEGVGVGLLLVEGEGHRWPQGARAWISRSIHVFFERHPKVVAPAPTAPAD